MSGLRVSARQQMQGVFECAAEIIEQRQRFRLPEPARVVAERKGKLRPQTTPPSAAGRGIGRAAPSVTTAPQPGGTAGASSRIMLARTSTTISPPAAPGETLPSCPDSAAPERPAGASTAAMPSARAMPRTNSPRDGWARSSALRQAIATRWPRSSLRAPPRCSPRSISSRRPASMSATANDNAGPAGDSAAGRLVSGSARKATSAGAILAGGCGSPPGGMLLPAPACKTSAALMRPLGPLPSIPASATPACRASRRAYGVAMIRASTAAAGGVAASVELPAADHRADRDVVAGRSQMQQHGAAARRLDLVGDLVGLDLDHADVALAKRSPTATAQRATRPSVIVRPSFGMTKVGRCGHAQVPGEGRRCASRGRRSSPRARRRCRAPGRSSPARAPAPTAAACRRRRAASVSAASAPAATWPRSWPPASFAAAISSAFGTTLLASPIATASARRDLLAGEHDLLGAAQRHLADDALRAAGAGKQPEGDLRQAEPRRIGQDADVGAPGSARCRRRARSR